MKCIHIITPVKDSIELTLQTVDAIMASDVKTPFTYTVYNDFSTEENTARLREASGRLGFELVNLADVTSHPSPNYLLILQMSQERAIAEEIYSFYHNLFYLYHFFKTLFAMCTFLPVGSVYHTRISCTGWGTAPLGPLPPRAP